MNYLSKQNIIHRDLALRNLLVTERINKEGIKYIVKVAGKFKNYHCYSTLTKIDFGMAKLIAIEQEYYKIDDKTIPVKWCAPEVIEFGKFSSQSGW